MTLVQKDPGRHGFCTADAASQASTDMMASMLGFVPDQFEGLKQQNEENAKKCQETIANFDLEGDEPDDISGDEREGRDSDKRHDRRGYQP